MPPTPAPLPPQVFYRSNPAREAFVEMCESSYVQKMTFDSYLYKTGALPACLPACLLSMLPRCLPACLLFVLPRCLPACLPAVCVAGLPAICVAAGQHRCAPDGARCMRACMRCWGSERALRHVSAAAHAPVHSLCLPQSCPATPWTT